MILKNSLFTGDKIMFQFFFSEYKKIISTHNNTYKKPLSKFDIALIIVSLIVPLIPLFFNLYTKLSFLLLIFPFTAITVLYFKEKKRLNSINLDMASDYKNNRINNLINLCSDSKFDLYDKKGIEFLMLMCDKKLNEETTISSLAKSISFFFNKFLYPMFAFIGGLVISDIHDINYIIRISIQTIGLIVICFCLYNAVKPVIYSFIYPDKDILENLHDDLEYIKLDFE